MKDGLEGYERQVLASSIRDARHDDANRNYTVSRGLEKYENILGLNENFFKYLTSIGSQKILDVGVGSGAGLNALNRKYNEKGFVFDGTYLTHSILEREPDVKHVFFQTAVERLKNVKSESYGAVLGLFSVTYSKLPDLAVKSIDRVLVPGGIFVGVFSDSMVFTIHSEGSQPKEFEQSFKERKYLIQVTPDLRFRETFTLKAVKPPYNEEGLKGIVSNTKE